MRRPALVIVSGLTVALVGLAMIQWGRSIPPFVDRTQALAAFEAWCLPGGGIDDAAGRRYSALLTARYDWINAGVGIGFTGLVAALGVAFLVSRRRVGEPWLVTPRHRATFFLLGWLALAWSWLGSIGGLTFDLDRMQFPSCADSIGIPAFGLSFLAATLTIVLTLGGIVAMLRFGKLPVSLTVASACGHAWTVAVNVGCGLAAAMVLVVGCLTAVTADSFGTPAYLVALYLIASTRAALLARK